MSEGRMFRATLWEHDGKAFEYKVRISPMDAEEEHQRALRYECEELVAAAYQRGRREGLEEAISLVQSCVAQWQTPVSAIRSRLEGKL